ncbi:hypothetical protein [Nostoc sp. CHAB 5715]|nr:hypothetical protein [Nostoc sp. CHAB 5715]MCC5623373.1 hypothetical protein [Nostoc sp. CHAB 5715]
MKFSQSDAYRGKLRTGKNTTREIRGIINAQCPMPHAPCPMPNAPCP